MEIVALFWYNVERIWKRGRDGEEKVAAFQAMDIGEKAKSEGKVFVFDYY